MEAVPRWVNAANLFTLLRLAAVPFAVRAILAGEHKQALVFVGFAAVTDAFDGAIARHFNQATDAGAYFDPIVDKIFLSAIFISLALIASAPWWLVIEIFARDLLILALSGVALAFTTRRKFPPSIWGKASTLLQILCALSLLVGNATPAWTASHVLVWPTAILTAASGFHYAGRAVIQPIDGGLTRE